MTDPFTPCGLGVLAGSTPAPDKEGVVERVVAIFDERPDLQRLLNTAELAAFERLRALSSPPVVEEAGLCPHCDDSGYVETSRGGHWTGENLSSSMSICDCPCGDDVRRERATPTPPAGEEEIEQIAAVKGIDIDVLGALMVLKHRSQAATDCLAKLGWRPDRAHIEGMRNAMTEALQYLEDARAVLRALPSPRGITIPDELRELSRRATQGEWEVQDGCSWRRIGTRFRGDGNVLCPTTYSAKDNHPDLTCGKGEDLYANLRFIVAAVNFIRQALKDPSHVR